jgi:LacI family transcriptional regulator
VAARELGYQPDRVAQSMRRRRTNHIGLVISTIENEFFTQVAFAAERAALRHGYSLLISSTDERVEREEMSITALRQQLVAGIILAPAPGDLRERGYLDSEQTPTVLINRELDDARFPSVTADDDEAAYQCTSWLLDQGRRRIGVISGLADVSTTRERLNGYARALAQHEIPRYPDLEIPGRATVQGGYQAAWDLMIRSSPPDAIFVHNNVMLMGATLALGDLGISWPDHVDLAGFGVFTASRLYQPPLTLIAQPTYEMADRAVALLVDRIAGRGLTKPSRIRLANRLVTREHWLEQRRDRETEMRMQLSGDGAGTSLATPGWLDMASTSRPARPY